jgi:hypothetical protein
MTAGFKKLIAELDERLLAKHRADQSLFADLTDRAMSSGISHGARAISPFLRPYFLPASRYIEICNAARTLSGAFEKLTYAALEEPAMMNLLGLTDRERTFAELDPGYKAVSVTGRLDAFLTPAGFKFLEYNAENPAGVGDQSSLERLYRHIPTVNEFLNANPHFFPKPHIRLLDSMVSVYREFGGRKEKPNIAIVDWAGVDTSAEFEILREYFESMGHASLICDPEELEYDGLVLRRGEFEIDIFYKRVIIHEFLQRHDLTHQLSAAIADRSVCMVNSFRSKVPHKKASFAILSDPNYRGLFNEAENEAILTHIPWTRRVAETNTLYDGLTIDLVQFIRRERGWFVIKPNDDYGGKGVTFGWEATESEWDDALAAALDGDFVVQKRVDVERTEIPVYRDGAAEMQSLTVDLDPYLFLGEVEGGMVRLAPGSLVNITQGGGETALAVLNGY